MVPLAKANALSKLSKSRLPDSPKTAADLPFDPRSVGAAKIWDSVKGRLKAAELPTSRKIRFIPKKGYDPANPLAKGPNGGYIDRFGNEWVKRPIKDTGAIV